MKTRLLLLLVLCSAPLSATVRFLNGGASGSGNGSTWTNGYTTTTAMNTASSGWAAGDILCMAGGTYGGQGIVTNSGGSSGNPIIYRRATASDSVCGSTSAGWNSAFDATVIISGGALIQNSNITISGNGIAGGLSMPVANASGGPQLGVDTVTSNIILTYLEFPQTGCGSSGCNQNADTTAISMNHFNGSSFDLQTNWLIDHVNMHGECTTMQMASSTSLVIQYSRFADSIDLTPGNPNCHPNSIFYSGGATNPITFRYNEVVNNQVEGILSNAAATWDVYGNNIHDPFVSGGNVSRFFEAQNSTVTVHEYNNTFVGYSFLINNTANSGVIGSGSVSNNNIFVNSATPGLPTNDYDAFNGSTGGETHGQNISTSIFTNFAGQNYTLASDTAAGTTLSSPFNVDLNGTVRGANGTWDRGYYQIPGTVTNPSFGSYCTASNSCSLTSVVGASIVFEMSNFNTAGSTATLDGVTVPVFTSYPTIWDAGTATSTVWVAYNVSAGSHTVSITNLGGDHFNTMQAVSVTGTSPVNPVEYVHSSLTGTAASCTGTATTTHTNDLLVSFINAAGSTVVSLGTSTQSMTLASGAGGNVGAAYGVVPTASSPTAVWNITSGAQWVCDTLAFKPAASSPPTVSSVAVTPVSPSVVANAHITLTATATYSDGGLQDVSGAASTWASSNTAVALISTLGVVNPQSAGTTNATATFNSVTSPNDLVTVTPYTPVNWYIRPAGGTRFSSNVPTGQCDGKGDVNYPGSGTNQHCAFNDVRFLVFDGSSATDPTFPARGWVIASSDIVTIRGSIGGGVSYRIGYPANGDPSTGGGYPFFGISGDVGNSGIPSPPPGSVSQPTTIQGENFAACHTGGSVTLGGHILQSALTQLYGGWGIGHIIDLYGTQNIKLQCLDLTDHAQCGTLAAGTGSPQCKSGSTVLADYAATGLHFHNNSTGIILNDISIHGLGGAGIGGSPGDGFVANYLDINGNENAGWNADDSDGTTGVGSLNVTNFNINWNGCIEEYPIVDTVPYIYCRDQGTGGYGDGFGTASLNSNPPGWQVHFDQGTVAYNTQDGLDALHIGGPGSTMTESRVLAYGNEGQQLKVGGATGHIVNSKIFGNCDALDKATLYNPGGPGEFGSEVNSNIATFHVANNVFSIGDTLVFSGLVNLTGLNGTTATVLASGLSNAQFSVSFTHADTVHGQILQLYQNQHGSGMTLGTYPVTFTGGGGTGAAGTFQATSATDGIPTITNPGSGYTSNPTVSVSGTGGTPPPIYAQIVANEQGNATYPITGRTINTLDDLNNICRAGNSAIFATVSPGFTTTIQNNTIYANGQIGLEIEYADMGNIGSTNVAQYDNNVFMGYPANAYANPGTTPNPIFSNTDLNMFSNAGGSLSHNSFLNGGHGFVCSTFGTAPLCTDPGLVNETMPPTATVNVTPASGASAVVGGGIFLSAIPLDFAGLTRPNPPSIGSLEFAGAPPTVAPPTASPVAGTYTSTQTVTLSTVTGGATICYTINGTTPAATTAGTCDVGSTTYSGTITVATTTTIKALGTLSGDLNSSVATFAYTITPPVVATPTASPIAGTYTSTQLVVLSDATSGATICFTTDGSTPTAPTAGTCSGGTTQTYSTAISVATTTTIKAIGTKVANTNSSVFSGLYTIIPPPINNIFMNGHVSISGKGCSVLVSGACP